MSNASRIPGAGAGQKKPSAKEVMTCFDILPVGIRRFVSQSAFDWNVCMIAKHMCMGRSEADLLAHLHSQEAMLLAECERSRADA